MPVVEITPPVTSRPVDLGLTVQLFQLTPGCARTVSLWGSTWIPFIRERSIVRPPSVSARPATAVATTPDRQLQVLVPSGRDRRRDVGDALTLRNERPGACRSGRCRCGARRRSRRHPGLMMRPRTLRAPVKPSPPMQPPSRPLSLWPYPSDPAPWRYAERSRWLLTECPARSRSPRSSARACRLCALDAP